ncbi:MAG: DUF1631 family protein [Rhodocyclaceae bacterium]|nr:DUF1631 family protein [Rhodocyclaceae bacterium]
MSATRDGTAALLASCRSQFLDVLVAFARDRGFGQPEWIEGLTEEAGAAFDELVGLKDRQGFEMAKSLTASRISLVHEEDLEFSIVLTDVARRIRERCEHELARLHLRMMRLLDHRDTDSAQSPVGPEAACRGLRGLSDAAGLDPDLRLRLVSDNAEELGHLLIGLYRTLDRQLSEAGLTVATRTRPGSEASRQPPGRAPVGHSGGPMAAFRDSLLPAGGAPAAAHDETPDDLLRLLHQWIDEHCSEAGGSLADGPLGPILPARRAAAVRAIERIFDALAGEAALAVGLRRALAHLRVPLLKLALRDDGLFSIEDHPANRLMRAMATACAGLRPEAPSPWFDRVDRIAGEVRQPGDDIGRALTLALGATESLIDERMEATREAARTVGEAARRSERHDQCLEAASRAVRGLGSEALPAAVADFLELYWVQVLARTAYAHGADSPAYLEHLRASAELAASVTGDADPATRRRLMPALPPLIKRLQSGLDVLGLDERQRNAALLPCMDLHAALIRGASPPAHKRAAPAGLRLRPVPGCTQARLLMHGGHTARDAVAPKWLQGIEVGDWVYLNHGELGHWHGCVGWIGPHRQLLTLVAGDGSDLLLVTFRALSELSEKDAAHLLQIPSPMESCARKLSARRAA